jgi:hypothetical protein
VFLGFDHARCQPLLLLVKLLKYLLKSTPELESTPNTILDCFYWCVFSSTNCFSILGSTEKMPTTSVQWNINIPGCCGFRCWLFWEQGVIKVNTGSLAIMNNALIPVGLIVNLVIWNKEADIKKMVVVLFRFSCA